MLLFSMVVFGQGGNPVTGAVLDEKGVPLQGVSVTVKGTTYGTVTDSSGRFTIRVAKGGTLVFSYIRYSTQEVLITNERTLSLTMSPTTTSMNDVVVVGYGTQRKATLTGSVAQISGAEIVTTKNENIENMLTGKVPGLQILQNTAEPGDFANNISIRGMGNPLIVIDGVQIPDFSVTGNNGDNNVGSSNILTRLDPNDIESISVLKDASASVYGVKAANGVILITTKRGKSGALQLAYTGTYGWQVPSGLPKPVNAVQYMTLVNQQALHNANGGILTYNSADFAAYANGTKKSTDWYDAVFRKHAMQQQHNLTATGGSENTTYLLSAGYTDQDGLLTTNDLNYKRYNVRSNVTSRIGKRITVNLNISGIVDQKNAPAQSFWWTTREAWRELPTQTIYANSTSPYYTNGIVDGGNPVVFENSDIVGYSVQNNIFLNGAIGIDYKFPFIDGLTLRGFFSYNDQLQDNKLYQKTYNLYTYDAASSTYRSTLNGSPSYVQRQYYHYPHNTDQFSINYAHNFGGIHNVTALLLMEGNEQSGDNFAAYRQLAIPVDQIIAGNTALQNATQDGGNTALYQYATNSFVGRVTYDFNSRYLAEFSFRDDKSSKFAPGQGWGFFPSASVGWRLSEENFWKNSRTLSFVDNLKLRGSYGVLGDDGQLYYQFLSGYNYPANGSYNQLPSGAVFGSSFVNAVQSTGIPNPKVTWATSHTFDLGIDVDAWKGLLGFTADYFVRNRKGLLATSILQVPEVLGAPLPEENLNGDRTRGFDLEVTHRNRIGKLTYNIKGTFSYTNTMNTVFAEARQGNSYLDWLYNQANRNQGIQMGYGAAGQYQNYSQIVNSPIYVSRNTVVGDYIYEDWNGQGFIDGNSIHPIAYGGNPNGTPVFPKIVYGLTLGAAYDGFDVSILFQGTSIYNVSYIEQLNIPLWGGGSALTQFLNDWHPANPTANPYNPNTVWVPGQYAYTGTTAGVNSSFNFQNGAYLRLKSAEIGYSLSDKLLRTTGIKGVRFFTSGYNLLTFTKVKYVDPEHPSGTYGYLYPLDKLFNLGLNVKF
ncbi:SusC/RagA family TonB-linked outer membrane protein [Puia dinghuensis]|uniref:SusC/RagA family TonB-linked outer membrane protein n=2 Tax=Puia dinghuensis TaxID=1792502 RepID=A0A8J2U799_9BACT|nr:SusC/RagA family TonB-linked outer membrane protein [Puia dinghuensis]